MTEICTADGQNMQKYAQLFSKYAQNMHLIYPYFSGFIAFLLPSFPEIFVLQKISEIFGEYLENNRKLA